MRQLDILVLVEQFALSVFFVTTPEGSLILQVLSLEVFAKLRDLSCQRFDHLLLALNDIVKLHFF